MISRVTGNLLSLQILFSNWHLGIILKNHSTYGILKSALDFFCHLNLIRGVMS